MAGIVWEVGRYTRKLVEHEQYTWLLQIPVWPSWVLSTALLAFCLPGPGARGGRRIQGLQERPAPGGFAARWPVNSRGKPAIVEPITIGLLSFLGMLTLIAIHVPVGIAMAIAGVAGFSIMTGNPLAAISMFGSGNGKRDIQSALDHHSDVPADGLFRRGIGARKRLVPSCQFVVRPSPWRAGDGDRCRLRRFRRRLRVFDCDDRDDGANSSAGNGTAGLCAKPCRRLDRRRRHPGILDPRPRRSC